MAVSQPGVGAYDVEAVRSDFPILGRALVGDRPLIYLDSANTSQKPQAVIDAIEAHYRVHNANVARAMHQLGAEATQSYEDARAAVAAFVGADAREICFTKNASEALNLAANSLSAHAGVGAGDEIVVSVAEHHSNIVPWQMVCERTGATLRWFDVTDDGRLALDADLINERTKIVSVTAASNVTGALTDVAALRDATRAVGAHLVLDASQAVPQMPVDVHAWDADLVAFTGHKMCGPTGIGVLYGRFDLLAAMPPFLGGGEMIEVVTMEKTTYAAPPARFEAGTPPIAQAVGLGAAATYLNGIGMAAVAAHERAITAYALDGLTSTPGVRIIGPRTAVDRGGAISFEIDGVHPHDVATVLDTRGVAVRAGHHCARPLHTRFGVQSSVRASGYLYTTTAEIDALIDAVGYVRSYFKVA